MICGKRIPLEVNVMMVGDGTPTLKLGWFESEE